MGLIDRYNKAQASGTGLASENPEIAPPKQGNPEAQFKGSNLDLEFEAPNGGPINVSYTTRVGGINQGETKTFPTTQPYTPKNTYTDNLRSNQLRGRATDPFR